MSYDYETDFATAECEQHGDSVAIECSSCGMDTCAVCVKCEWCEADV